MSTTAPARQKAMLLTYERLALLPGGLSPVDLWLNLHTAQGSWGRIEDATQRDNAVASARLMLESLAEFPVSRWLAFNHAIGWIEPACAAASWCQGAELADVISVWNMLRFMPAPAPGMDFAARLFNPKLLPQEWDLAPLAEAGGGNTSGVSLLVAARDDAPALHLSDPENYFRKNCPPELARMLALRNAIPMAWVGVAAQAGAASPNAAAAAPEKPAAPQLTAEERERKSFEARVAAILPHRRKARGWTEEEIEAALSSGEGIPVSGLRNGEAKRHVLPAPERSLAVDETGLVIHVGRPGYLYGDVVGQLPVTKFPPMAQPRDRRQVTRSDPGFEMLYMPLRDEFVDVWRPVLGLRLDGDVSRSLGAECA